MTSPVLAEDTEQWGRLYRDPRRPVPFGLPPAEQRAHVHAGLLMPSITTVEGVLDKPYLRRWHGKRAAQDAVALVQEHPGLIESKPWKAVRWLTDAADRTVDEACDRGDRVHQRIEALLTGEQVDPVTADIAPYMQAWESFMTDFSPEFLAVETTVFGEVPTSGDTAALAPLRYAGTADGIVRVGGLTCGLDWKTGRSVGGDAVMQQAAIAHADWMCADGRTVEAMPDLDLGLVVHLTPSGYRVHPTPLDGRAWALWQSLRVAWEMALGGVDEELLPSVSSPDALLDAVVGEEVAASRSAA